MKLKHTFLHPPLSAKCSALAISLAFMELHSTKTEVAGMAKYILEQYQTLTFIIHHPIPIAISMRMLAALQICPASLSPSSKLTSSSTTICHELRALLVLTTAELLCGTDGAYCLSQSSHPVRHTWNTQPSRYLKDIYILM